MVLVEHIAEQAAALLVAPLVVVLLVKAVDQHMLSILGVCELQHTLAENYTKESFALGSYMDSIDCFKKYLSTKIIYGQ